MSLDWASNAGKDRVFCARIPKTQSAICRIAGWFPYTRGSILQSGHSERVSFVSGLRIRFGRPRLNLSHSEPVHNRTRWIKDRRPQFNEGAIYSYAWDLDPRAQIERIKGKRIDLIWSIRLPSYGPDCSRKSVMPETNLSRTFGVQRPAVIVPHPMPLHGGAAHPRPRSSPESHTSTSGDESPAINS